METGSGDLQDDQRPLDGIEQTPLHRASHPSADDSVQWAPGQNLPRGSPTASHQPRWLLAISSLGSRSETTDPRSPSRDRHEDHNMKGSGQAKQDQQITPWRLQVSLHQTEAFGILTKLSGNQVWQVLGASLRAHSNQQSPAAIRLAQTCGKGAGKSRSKSKKGGS